MIQRLLVMAAVLWTASCGSGVAPPAAEVEVPDPDGSVDPPLGDAGATPATTADDGVAADAGSDEARADAGAEEVTAERAAEVPTDPRPVPDVHPLLEAYREKVGAWMTDIERRRIERADLSHTGRADGAALAELVQTLAMGELLPAVFDRVGSRHLREDARYLRKGSSNLGGEYEGQTPPDLLLNYTLVDFESTECYESDFRGRPRTRGYSDRCRIAFGAARLLTKPLGENLRWPEFGSFGNCRGESGYDPDDDMPCFTSGSEGGSLTLLFDLALEIGVPRRRVVAFAKKTFERVVREAVEQTRVAGIEFVPSGSRRLSTVIHDLKRWMSAAEWRRFDQATGVGSSGGLSQRAEDELFHSFGKRVLAPIWRKFGTDKARQVARALASPLVDDAKLLPFSAIWTRLDEDELLDDGEYLQCPPRPEARFDRCAAATRATSTFLALTDYWAEDDDGDPAAPFEGFDGLTAEMLDDLLAAGVSRGKLVRELTGVFGKALRAND
jgi:hypothetical protein